MNPIDRRSLLQRALVLAGATLTPGFTAEALAKAGGAELRLLDANRFTLLTAVADTMVPRTDTVGAVDVDVPARFDALLRVWAAPERRTQLIGALDAIDQHALARDKQGFARLAPAQRHALLTAHDAAALKPPAAPAVAPPTAGQPNPPPEVADPNYGRPKQAPPQTKQAGESLSIMSGPPTSDPDYAKLKDLIVTLYYISEPALTQELTYVHAPGEWKPSIPVTPDTRPAGGLNPI